MSGRSSCVCPFWRKDHSKKCAFVNRRDRRRVARTKDDGQFSPGRRADQSCLKLAFEPSDDSMESELPGWAVKTMTRDDLTFFVNFVGFSLCSRDSHTESQKMPQTSTTTTSFDLLYWIRVLSFLRLLFYYTAGRKRK